MAMSDEYELFPTAAQYQDYLEHYVNHHNLAGSLRLNTIVVRAEYDSKNKKWKVTTRNADGYHVENVFDALFICNGTLCDPEVPAIIGQDCFGKAGGQVVHSSRFARDVKQDLADMDVVVLGYGKSSCDLAVGVSERARSTTIVCRRTRWKLPPLIRGTPIDQKLVTRTGEHTERVLPGSWSIIALVKLLGLYFMNWYIQSCLPYAETKLTPKKRFAETPTSDLYVDTPMFFPAVKAGKISVLPGTEVKSLSAANGRPSAHLANGRTLPCDVLVCGTGFRQRVPFLDPKIEHSFKDEQGNFLLYEHVLPTRSQSSTPADYDKLYFVGYNSSALSTISFEAGALWSVAHLENLLAKQHNQAYMRCQAEEHIRILELRSPGGHCKGTVSLAALENIDELCKDMGVSISWLAWIKQWYSFIDPEAYRTLPDQLLRRQKSSKEVNMGKR